MARAVAVSGGNIVSGAVARAVAVSGGNVVCGAAWGDIEQVWGTPSAPVVCKRCSCCYCCCVLHPVCARAASVAVWVNTATVLTEQQRCVDSVLTCGCWRRYGVLACAGVVMCGGVGTGGCGAVELPHVCRVEPPDALTVCTLLL